MHIFSERPSVPNERLADTTEEILALVCFSAPRTRLSCTSHTSSPRRLCRRSPRLSPPRSFPTAFLHGLSFLGDEQTRLFAPITNLAEQLLTVLCADLRPHEATNPQTKDNLQAKFLDRLVTGQWKCHCAPPYLIRSDPRFRFRLVGHFSPPFSAQVRSCLVGSGPVASRPEIASKPSEATVKLPFTPPPPRRIEPQPMNRPTVSKCRVKTSLVISSSQT